MPELSAVTLLEQESQKRRMMRVFSGEICVIADYTKGEGLERNSDMEIGYWFGNSRVSIHILRIIIFLKPILYTLAVALDCKFRPTIGGLRELLARSL